MSQSQITYTDKVEDAGASPEGLVGADDLNEVKGVVNANAVDAETRLEGKAPASPSVFDIFSASDWPTTGVDGTQYNVHGAIPMAEVTMALPLAPARITICGIGPGASLTSAEDNYTMFTDGATSGAVKFQNILLTASGTDSKIGDFTNDGTGAFVLDRVSLSGCTLAFALSGYNFFQLKDSQDIGCTNVFELDGTWNALDVKTYGSFALASGGTTFSAVGSFNVTGRALFSPTCDMAAGTTFCDFAEANIAQDAGLEVLLSQFDGTPTKFFSGISEVNTKCRWRDNNWPATATENNTYIGSAWAMTTSAETAIGTAGVPVKVAGTTTYTDEQWFGNAGNNTIIYESTRRSKVIVAGSINISAAGGGQDKNITLIVRLWDDSASAYVDLPGQARGTATSAGAIRNATLINETDMEVNDRIELWVQNDTDTTNMVIEEGSYLAVTERAN